MSVVAPITVAWQSVVDSAKGQAKQVETYEKLSKAIVRAQEVVSAAKDVQDGSYAGTDPKAHITVHPGTYEYGSSIDSGGNLQDVFITILPGALVTDADQTAPPETTQNVADLNSFARSAFFSQKDGTFIYDSPVRFKDDVIFDNNQFPVKSVQGGDGISVDQSFGDVTVNHADTGGAQSNSDSGTFLNQVQLDDKGHVESVQFENVDSDKGVLVQDNTSEISPSASTLNFGENISAATTGGQTESVTVELPGTGTFEISDVENLLPIGKTVSKISGTEGVEAVLSSSVSGTNKNEVFQTGTETEKGVVTSSVEGDINPQVKKTQVHGANTFSPASTGVLKLVVNGSDLVTANLQANASTITKTSSNGSSLSVSAATPLKFKTGKIYEERTQRTGSWKVLKSDMSYGLNVIKVVHEDGNQNVIGESQNVRYFLENDLFTISLNPSFESISMNGSKTISGVTYNTRGTVDFRLDAENTYKNVYGGGEVIRYLQNKNIDLQNEVMPALTSSQGPDTDLVIQKTVSVSSDRAVGESIQTQAIIEDPIEGDVTSGLEAEFQILLDAVEKDNENLVHYFQNEKYRADPNSNFDSNLNSGVYDSSQSLKDGGQYGDQLQVTEGRVKYPSINYSAIDDGPANPDYSTGVSGERSYYGIFSDPNAVSNFVLEAKGQGTIVSKQNLSFGTDQTSIEIKVPTQTGWLDVNKAFCVGEHEDGDGAYQETNADSPSKTIGPDSEIGLTIGTKSTTNGFDKLYYRIKALGNWQGKITELKINWGIY